jgi:hypothetical protein
VKNEKKKVSNSWRKEKKTWLNVMSKTRTQMREVSVIIHIHQFLHDHMQHAQLSLLGSLLTLFVAPICADFGLRE